MKQHFKHKLQQGITNDDSYNCKLHNNFLNAYQDKRARGGGRARGPCPPPLFSKLKKIRKVLHLISFVDTRLRMFFYSRPQKGIIDRVR